MYNQSIIEALVSRALSEEGMTMKTVFHSAESRTVTSFFAGGAWELGRMQISNSQFSMVLVNGPEQNAMMLWAEPDLVEVWTSLLLNHASRLPGHQERIHLNLAQTMLWMESGIYQPDKVKTGLRVRRKYQPKRTHPAH